MQEQKNLGILGVFKRKGGIFEMEQVKQVSKDTMISELISINPQTAEILFGIGMHCIGCPASQMETLEEAASVHGVNVQDLVDEINDFLMAA